MRNFTKTKVLTLSAMLVLGSASVFGQGEQVGKDLPWDAAKYAGLTAAQKPILYEAEGNDVLPGFPGMALKTVGEKKVWGNGVYFRAFNKEVSDVYYPEITKKPTNNYTTTTVWQSGTDSLGIFLGDSQSGELMFDLSTKYMTNVRELKVKLSAENFGLAATSSADWHVTISVFDLDGNAVKKSDIFKSGTADDAVFESDGAIFETGAANVTDKVINLFDVVTDPITDQQMFLEGALDNKLIQVTLWSDFVAIKDVEETGSKSHFAPALVVSGFQMNFDEPTLALTADVTSFEAGLGLKSCTSGTLALSAENVKLPAKTTAEDAFVWTNVTNNNDVVRAEFEKESDGVKLEDEVTYDFQPKSIATFSGKYAAKVDETDKLNPIRLSAETETISANSVPDFNFAETHIFFNENCQTKTVGVTGKNIPDLEKYPLAFLAFEKQTTDQTNRDYTWTSYGNVDVTDNITLSDCGVIADGSVLTLKLREWTNDITREEAWKIAVDPDYLDEVEEYDAQAKFPWALAAARVGALWLTYEGENFDGTVGRYTADNVFFAPYNKKDALDNSRYASRVKKLVLHGSELKPTGNDGIAKVRVTLQNIANANQNDTDNQEFRFKLSEDGAWVNNNTDTLEISINTLDDAKMKQFREEGLPIYVQFVPNKDGFEAPETVGKKEWNPDTYELQVWAVGVESESDCPLCGVGVVAGLYGDTRANLWSNINKLNLIEEMHNSYRPTFNTNLPNLVYPEFQKYFGKVYEDECGYVNPLAVDSFYVAGYNLEKVVNVTRKANVSAYPNAFTYVIKDMLNGGAAVEKLTPNKYGEVLGLVVVTFNQATKNGAMHKAEDLFTVKSNENVINWTRGELNPNEKFGYTLYENAGEVYGFIYKPEITITPAEDITAAVDTEKEVKVLIEGKEFNPLTATEAIKISLGTVNYDNPFTLTAPANVKVDVNGSFTATATVKYAPTAATACAKENVLIVEANCLTNDLAIAGEPTVGDELPVLQPMVHGDIDGATAVLKWEGIPGADYYVVQVGHLAPKNTSKNVFMSEVLAKSKGSNQNSDILSVELFNGTGKVINPKMIVNYYLKVVRTDKAGDEEVYYGHFKNTTINTFNLQGGWTNSAVIISEFRDKKGTDENAGNLVNITISDQYRYNVYLMEGENQIDVFTFGEAGAHLARKAYNGMPENQGEFNITDWETINTSLVDGNGIASYWWEGPENVEFNLVDGAESVKIHAGNEANYTKDGKYLTVNVKNMKPNSLYDVTVTAYHPCLFADGKTLLAQEFIPTSQFVGDNVGEIEIEVGKEGTVTANDEINASAVKVVAGEGQITIVGAAGKRVAINNLLGQTIANTVITSDDAVIKAPAGIVVVAVEGETTVKAIVK